MRHLGHGWEGSASLYVDTADDNVVVAKTFFPAAMRNDIPKQLAKTFADYTTRWPTEIEAGLLLGDSSIGNATFYLPVKDYFILDSEPSSPASDHSHWRWTMVTPLMQQGTLLDLATATQVHERTLQELDKIFRPAFHSLLDALGHLHEKGYCHDDVKGDNIFVADAKHWLLGDLGNIRHFAHLWHATRTWRRKNQWANCELNDSRRALKSYMTFLRLVSDDTIDFDCAF